MYRPWSFVLMLWVTTAVAGGVADKRYLMNVYPGPGGDPSHQWSSQFNSSGSMGSHGGQMPLPSGPGGDIFHQGGASLGQNFQVPNAGGSGGVFTSPPVPTDTTTPLTPIPSTTTTTSSTVAATSPDFCGVAKQLCTANCPGGYLVDPADCTFCICKKDALPG